jgi:hypothetical protein
MKTQREDRTLRVTARGRMRNIFRAYAQIISQAK